MVCDIGAKKGWLFAVEESGKAGCKKESATNVESESLQAGDEVAIKTQDSEGDAPPDDFEYESPEDHDDDEWKPDSPQVFPRDQANFFPHCVAQRTTVEW